MKRKAIVAGHICIDITPVFPGKETACLTEFLSPGKLVNVNEAAVHTGGAVANTGLAMKILGADVTLMGKVGVDAFADMVRGVLKKYDAEEGLLVAKNVSTSYSLVLAMPGIDRIILHHTGANDTFCAEDIPKASLEEADLFHFGYPPLMRSMFVNGGEELIKIMKLAKDCGAATSLDCASIDPDAEAGKADWKAILEKVLPLADFFEPSVEELCYMLDRDRFYEWKKRAAGKDITEILDIQRDVVPLADTCMAYGAKVLIIKCGAAGMYYRSAGEEKLGAICEKLGLSPAQWCGKEGFEKSFVPQRVLSAIGAGDTSIAAFLTAVLEQYPLEKAISLAAATGASCVEAYDALSGLKTFDQLQAKIDAGWEKVK